MDGIYYFKQFIRNEFFWCVFITWVLAQFIKVIFNYFEEKRWDISRILRPGGMPSSHTAPMVALTTLIGIKIGFDSPLFVLSLLTTTVVMYDAAGVRHAAGEHAKLLNKLAPKVIPEEFKNLPEVLGHSAKEVAGGAILGIIVGIIFGI